jgi:hypothetical protein
MRLPINASIVLQRGERNHRTEERPYDFLQSTDQILAIIRSFRMELVHSRRNLMSKNPPFGGEVHSVRFWILEAISKCQILKQPILKWALLIFLKKPIKGGIGCAVIFSLDPYL